MTYSSLGSGAWCWIADPRAVRYDGRHRRTYVGWVAQTGDIDVSAYDHDSLARTTAVVHSKLQVDDHSNPALFIRPDGRLVVFYSAHSGHNLFYRVSRNPEDVSAWGPVQMIPTNTPGNKGFTYPNPIRLAAERRTFLFWRGGDYNPTFAVQDDGGDRWSPARNLIMVDGQRPYVKYDSDGEETIHFAFTNGHPSESEDVNIYYACYRAGGICRANGTRIGTLGQPISPAQADEVYNESSKAWIHDVAADSSGRPVVVFASFPSPGDHRYMYARWTGSRWDCNEITQAGGSISLDGEQPFYSGGITVAHEDPSIVYLSRDIAGTFELQTWKTPDGGASWSHHDLTANSPLNNYRPICPRGRSGNSEDMSVLWMSGVYDSYVAYKTSITARLADRQAPVADAHVSPGRGRVPLEVTFDRTALDETGASFLEASWDFGDGTQRSELLATHTYTAPGRYWPALTLTDDSGAKDSFVTEVIVDPKG